MTVSHELRKSGKSVVLTHGAFDLFHVGHASFLKASKKLGDYLIVGVESDERVRAYKSLDRPIIPVEERVKVFLENNYVDFVYVINEPEFNEKYYLRMYKQFYPKLVAYGKRFGAIEKLKRDADRLRRISFQELNYRNSDYQSTSSIIEKIRATKTD